jgi:hypothetical protein
LLNGRGNFGRLGMIAFHSVEPKVICKGQIDAGSAQKIAGAYPTARNVPIQCRERFPGSVRKQAEEVFPKVHSEAAVVSGWEKPNEKLGLGSNTSDDSRPISVFPDRMGARCFPFGLDDKAQGIVI